MFAELGEELLYLTARLPGRLVHAQEITSLQSPLQTRASYKLTFSDGLVIKGRRFTSLQRSVRATRLATLLEHLPFNRVLASRGIGRIEQWIEGQVLQTNVLTDSLAEWAGDLLGSVHTIAGFNALDVAAPPANSWYLGKIKFNLDEIVHRRAIDQDTARRIVEIAARTQPHCINSGLIHTDFCAENMVATPEGGLFVVDNENLRLGSLDYDVVKCWCRWPMTHSARRAFCKGYQHHRSLENVFEHLRFWAICALTQSARVRTKHQSVAQPLLDALIRVSLGEKEHLWPDFTPDSIHV